MKGLDSHDLKELRNALNEWRKLVFEQGAKGYLKNSNTQGI
jgi:hypothetical protein